MSTIISTREPSKRLLSSQIDELFHCHCPLLTSARALDLVGGGVEETESVSENELADSSQVKV